MTKLDYVYISTWSLGRDVDIRLRTFGRVLRRSVH
jgi:lipopolysaccharide/colanic/teichoic acid biosynthesis glycosyltransferase